MFSLLPPLLPRPNGRLLPLLIRNMLGLGGTTSGGVHRRLHARLQARLSRVVRGGERADVLAVPRVLAVCDKRVFHRDVRARVLGITVKRGSSAPPDGLVAVKHDPRDRGGVVPDRGVLPRLVILWEWGEGGRHVPRRRVCE